MVKNSIFRIAAEECGLGQLNGTLAGMLAVAGGGYTIAYGLVIFACLAVVGTVLHRLLPGESSPLLIDLPPMRLPRPGNVLRKIAVRSFFFMKAILIKLYVCPRLAFNLLGDLLFC